MRLAPFALAASVAVAGCATGPKPDEHAAHQRHAASGAGPSAGQVDSTMKSMHEMHERMKAARTPEERAALMKDHMKTMQDGMAMMGRMRGSNETDPQSVERRMHIMEMMMQMMMDRTR